jgi:DNA-binding MarR family transcriptional regulator
MAMKDLNFEKKVEEISKTTRMIWVMFSGMHNKRKSNITFHQYLTLENISESSNCTVNEIARKMKLAQSTASQLIDRLVQAKLVIREINPENRRSMLLCLSNEGKITLKKQEESIKKGYAELLKILDSEDQDKLMEAFKVLCEIGCRIEQK